MCDVTFASVDAVLEHLVNAHPSTTLASFVASSRDHPQLVHHDYVYTYSKNNGRKHYWACERRRPHPCRARAVTYGQTMNDVTSIVISASKHDHPPSSSKVRLARALHRMRVLAVETDDTPLAIRQQLFATVDADVAKLLPSEDSMRKAIARKRQKAVVKVKDKAKGADSSPACVKDTGRKPEGKLTKL